MLKPSISNRLNLAFTGVMAVAVFVAAFAAFHVNGIKRNLRAVNEVNSVKQQHAITIWFGRQHIASDIAG